VEKHSSPANPALAKQNGPAGPKPDGDGADHEQGRSEEQADRGGEGIEQPLSQAAIKRKARTGYFLSGR
jgi:hypothetical protein